MNERVSGTGELCGVFVVVVVVVFRWVKLEPVGKDAHRRKRETPPHDRDPGWHPCSSGGTSPQRRRAAGTGGCRGRKRKETFGENKLLQSLVELVAGVQVA